MTSLHVNSSRGPTTLSAPVSRSRCCILLVFFLLTFVRVPVGWVRLSGAWLAEAAVTDLVPFRLRSGTLRGKKELSQPP